jgi:hypothetical protein
MFKVISARFASSGVKHSGRLFFGMQRQCIYRRPAAFMAIRAGLGIITIEAHKNYSVMVG